MTHQSSSPLHLRCCYGKICPWSNDRQCWVQKLMHRGLCTPEKGTLEGPESSGRVWRGPSTTLPPTTRNVTSKGIIIPRRLVLSTLSGLLVSEILLRPGTVLAEPPPPVPTIEVPAAVNAVNTEENAQIEQDQTPNQKQNRSPSPSGAKSAEQVFLELSRDGESLGRVVIKVYQQPPLGSQRFLELARRSAGGYRLSKVDGISDDFITFSGVLQQNYVGIPTLPGGETVEQIEAEQAVFARGHDKAGLVSLIVEDAGPKDVRDKLVAYQGKFIKVQEVRGASNANATGFAITLGPVPLLDKTNLIVGEVVEGLDVVQQISSLPRVKSSSNSPFFKVAKALGDRRADVAARSFGKPIGRIIIDKVSTS